jgi:hypothetical protein
MVNLLGLGRAGALTGGTGSRTTVVEPVDRTLGGLVEVSR